MNTLDLVPNLFIALVIVKIVKITYITFLIKVRQLYTDFNNSKIEIEHAIL